MEIHIFSKPKLVKPQLIAAWPGMGYLAKISADYLRRRLSAKLFAEIRFYQNALIYKDSIAKLSPIRHRFYAASKYDLLLCIGEAQPSIPEEAYRLAQEVVKLAESFNVRRIYTMAAYPNDYFEEPQVFGVYTDENLKESFTGQKIHSLRGEGAINGLNGILIGVAKDRGIEGICLMGEIRYANVPQHLSSKAVLDQLTSFLGIEIDTSYLERRAKRVESTLRKKLETYKDTEEDNQKEKNFGYIS